MRTTTDAVSSNSNSGSNRKNNSNNQLSARNQSAPDEHQPHKAPQSSSLCARSAANTRAKSLCVPASDQQPNRTCLNSAGAVGIDDEKCSTIIHALSGLSG